MNNVRLQNFVTDTAARGRITFGDVRRLHRDYLPGGVSSREEAEMLLELDTKIGRADSAWTDWLVAAIVEFAVWSEPPIDGVEGGTGEWLNGVLAAMSKTTKAGRKIAREVRRTADCVQRIDCIAVPAALPAAGEFNVNELQLAAQARVMPQSVVARRRNAADQLTGACSWISVLTASAPSGAGMNL